MGLRPRTFIYAKNIRSFNFWSPLVIKKSEIRPSYDECTVFERTNIANGFGQLSFSSANQLCEHYNSARVDDNSLSCAPLNKAIKELNWHSNDLTNEMCNNMARKTLWLPDHHDGTRIDIASTLLFLGHDPVLAGKKGTSSPFPGTMKLIRQSTSYSRFINEADRIQMRGYSDEQIRENYWHYKRDVDFKGADAVVCAFPSAMCEAFMPLNQSLIFTPAHRYNLVRCTLSGWKDLNSNYDILNAKSKLIVAGTSVYDREYQYHYSGYK